jgi:6-phosphogluconolactonase/glucosamine-6-phosphate isomerase/deaminase
MESGKAIVMANGSKKAEIIKRALEEEISPAVPASIIRHHPHGLVILDEDAASLLKNNTPQ